MRVVFLITVFFFAIGCSESKQTGSGAPEKNGQKAVDIYVSVAKRLYRRQVPQEEQKCLTAAINELNEGNFKSAGGPLKMPEDWITFEKFTEDVNAIEFYSNGELSSADALVLPVVAHIDLISMNVCQP